MRSKIKFYPNDLALSGNPIEGNGCKRKCPALSMTKTHRAEINKKKSKNGDYRPLRENDSKTAMAL